jgi:hypothetical protein
MCLHAGYELSTMDDVLFIGTRDWLPGCVVNIVLNRDLRTH